MQDLPILSTSYGRSPLVSAYLCSNLKLQVQLQTQSDSERRKNTITRKEETFVHAQAPKRSSIKQKAATGNYKYSYRNNRIVKAKALSQKKKKTSCTIRRRNDRVVIVIPIQESSAKLPLLQIQDTGKRPKEGVWPNFE